MSISLNNEPNDVVTTFGPEFKNAKGLAALPIEIFIRIVFHSESSRDIKALSVSSKSVNLIIEVFKTEKATLEACKIFLKTLCPKFDIIDVRSPQAVKNGAISISKLALLEGISDINSHLEDKSEGYTLLIMRNNVKFKDQRQSAQIKIFEPTDFSIFNPLDTSINKTAKIILIPNGFLRETGVMTFHQQEIFLKSMGCRMPQIEEALPYLDSGVSKPENEKPSLFGRGSGIRINVQNQFFGFPLALDFNVKDKKLTGNLVRNFPSNPNTLPVKELNSKSFLVKPW